MSLSQVPASVVAIGPPDYTARLSAPADGSAARAFCLRTIQEVFGHGYRPDWHADLDALAGDDHDYLPGRRGALLLVEREGELVGTAALRRLTATPHLVRRFTDRYPEPERVGSVWRTYLDAEHRSRGVGAALLRQLETLAAGFGYQALYLHTSGDSPRSVSFWRSQGYRPFARDDDGEATVHLDRELPSA